MKRLILLLSIFCFKLGGNVYFFDTEGHVLTIKGSIIMNKIKSIGKRIIQLPQKAFNKKHTLQDDQLKYSNDLDIIRKKFIEVAINIAKRQNLPHLIYKNNCCYLNPSFDLTPRIIAEFNRLNK